ncbi:uncharacterized protein MONOS_17454 [Monocercomonoides exilis]|uniref:uncharacterized protein n=1 Tax=Monocercomonoides exilis TaxID=2049356 RepID=UPI0035597937|nr:hypothetical protein MONOS_17454 [Monocercomonoides exilis]
MASANCKKKKFLLLAAHIKGAKKKLMKRKEMKKNSSAKQTGTDIGEVQMVWLDDDEKEKCAGDLSDIRSEDGAEMFRSVIEGLYLKERKRRMW